MTHIGWGDEDIREFRLIAILSLSVSVGPKSPPAKKKKTKKCCRRLICIDCNISIESDRAQFSHKCVTILDGVIVGRSTDRWKKRVFTKITNTSYTACPPASQSYHHTNSTQVCKHNNNNNNRNVASSPYNKRLSHFTNTKVLNGTENVHRKW